MWEKKTCERFYDTMLINQIRAEGGNGSGGVREATYLMTNCYVEVPVI